LKANWSLGGDAWTRKSGPFPLQLALATFAILALELAIIRWISGQIRMFAYFNNLILIGAFLGMGLGVVIGRRRPALVHLTMPALCILSAILAFSEELGLMHMRFPDVSVHLWGAEASQDLGVLAVNMLVVLALLWLVITIFIFAGSAVGNLFGRMPTLKAYTYDLAGSLLGVIAVTVFTSFETGPHVWIALGCLPVIWLSKRPSTVICGIGACILAWISVQGAYFSPYNRIDMIATREADHQSYMLSVNRDFHQYMHDLSDSTVEGSDSESMVRTLRRVYDIPFILSPDPGRALVVGAGTGNDVQAALRQGYQEVYSVDIDGSIIGLGRQFHPEKPYQDPRAIPVVQDARAFFEQYEGPAFDVVCYGLLDSHSMFSAMTSLRLENYVYTEQGLRSAWRHVAPDGILALSFSVFAGEWIADRIYWTLEKATGIKPTMIHHGMHFGRTFIISRDLNRLDLSRIAFPTAGEPKQPKNAVRTTSDDWPFLYIRPGAIPWGYILLISLVLITASVATLFTFGPKRIGRDFHPALFFMGAAFLLIETRGVTNLSLILGSTWVVNASVFSGILFMVLIANIFVYKFRVSSATRWFIPLFGAVVLLWALDPGVFNTFPLLTRGVLGGLFNALPIAFAGVIVSILLVRSVSPAAALGSNLLGSLFGGCIEYFSMWVGLKALAATALVLYLIAFIFFRRSQTQPEKLSLQPEDLTAEGIPASD